MNDLMQVNDLMVEAAEPPPPPPKPWK